MGEFDELRESLTIEDRDKVDQRGRHLALQRQRLRLFRSPVRTLYYFAACSARNAWLGLTWLAHHRLTLFLLVPLLVGYTAVKVSGVAAGTVREVETWAWYLVWWVGLGVLSSIGLGTGMHSGLLFLFPHILKVLPAHMGCLICYEKWYKGPVCLAAEECGHLDFDDRTDMWWSAESFHCGNTPRGTPHFLDIVLKVLPVSMLWGSGTALGEVPPYAFSYAAAKAGLRNEATCNVYAIRTPAAEPGLFGANITRMSAWMTSFIARFGFWGILLLAAYPNALFDLCGICCGRFMMPFWKFFGATLLGKAVVKVTGQALVLVLVFMHGTRERLMEVVEWCLPDRIPLLWPVLGLTSTPAQMLHAAIVSKIADFRASVASRHASAQLDKRWFYARVADNFRTWDAVRAWAWSYVPVVGGGSTWTTLVCVMISSFIIGCIEQFAQGEALTQHTAELLAQARRMRAQY